MARTIVVANHKCGVGKTTTAVTLATGLADMGRRALLVDTDPQGSVGAFLGLEPARGLLALLVAGRTLEEVVLPVPDHPNLQVILSDESTVDINTLLVSGSRRLKTRTAIADVLAPVWRNGRTIVILDTAPSLSAVQVSALAASDWLIIPATPSTAARPGSRSSRRRWQSCGSRAVGFDCWASCPRWW